jgi:ankyrin repeat protein
VHLVRRLLQQDPARADVMRPIDGRTPLHIAASIETRDSNIEMRLSHIMAQLLLNYGEFCSPQVLLLVTCKPAQVNLWLLNATGADPHAVDNQGCSPLHLLDRQALGSIITSRFSLLAPPAELTHDPAVTIWTAIASADMVLVATVLQEHTEAAHLVRPSDGCTPLLFAATIQTVDDAVDWRLAGIIIILLSGFHADVHAVDSEGRTARQLLGQQVPPNLTSARIRSLSVYSIGTFCCNTCSRCIS